MLTDPGLGLRLPCTDTGLPREWTLDLSVKAWDLVSNSFTYSHLCCEWMGFFDKLLKEIGD